MIRVLQLVSRAYEGHICRARQRLDVPDDRCADRIVDPSHESRISSNFNSCRVMPDAPDLIISFDVLFSRTDSSVGTLYIGLERGCTWHKYTVAR
jgi:hypothetical protein